MFIRFTSKSKLGNLLPSSKKKYSLHEADEKLKELDRVFYQADKLVQMQLELTVKQKNDGFDVEFVSGNQENTNLLLLLEQAIDSYTIINKKEKTEWKTNIEEAYTEEAALPQEAISVNHTDARPSSEKIKKKLKRLKKLSIIHLIDERSKLKKSIFIIVPILLMISFGWFWFSAEGNRVPKKESKVSYETFFKERKYKQLVKEHPEQERKVLDELYLEKNKQGLKELAKPTNTGLANLYLAFLEGDWAAVTFITKVPQDADIQALRGYAFLQQGKIEEAELINKEIKNETLSTQIMKRKKGNAYQFLREKKISEAEKINSEIKDKTLTEDIVVAKSMLNLLNKYNADRHNNQLSEEERKEAETNYHLWESNLQQLGH